MKFWDNAGTPVKHTVAVIDRNNLFTADQSPSAAGGNNLGTSSLPWQSLYLSPSGSSYNTQLATAALTGNRTVVTPDANSVTVVPSSAGSNQCVVGLSSGGNLSYAQLGISNLTGLPVTVSEGGLGTTTTPTDGQLAIGQTATSSYSPYSISGDVLLSKLGAMTIANNAVSNAKLRQSVAASIVGNSGSSTANVADITFGANQTIFGNSGGTGLSVGTLPAVAGGTGSSVNPTNGQLAIGQTSTSSFAPTTVSGDGTINNSGVFAVGTNAISNAKFRQSAAASLVGNTGSSTANVADITVGANQTVFGNSSGNGLTVGTLPPTGGGTGSSTAPTDGQVAVGDSSTSLYGPATIGTTTGISTTVGHHSLILNNTGVTSIVQGAGVVASGPTGAVTLSTVPKPGNDGLRLSANTTAIPTSDISSTSTLYLVPYTSECIESV